MRLLFFSSDRAEVEQVWSALLGAGIRCEIQGESTEKGNRSKESKEGGTELWIAKDKDYHKAAMLCARLGVGFCSRPENRPGA